MVTKTILVTGGTGYIGSHVCVDLLNYGYNVVVVDNLSNSKIHVIDSIKDITGATTELSFNKVDLLNRVALEEVFERNQIDWVIHCSALKSVPISISEPLNYYENNVVGTINLLRVMEKFGCHNIIFSSSACVYGSQKSPLKEDDQIGVDVTNPYGQTKCMVEQMLMDLEGWNVTILRYFNPIGCHPSGLLPINTDDTGIMAALVNTVTGKQDEFLVYGSELMTRDGTCIRDFIHVCDISYGHLMVIEAGFRIEGLNVYNLGCGEGTTVQEVLDSFVSVTGYDIPCSYVEPREGDVPELWCNADKAYWELGWYATFSLEDIFRDTLAYFENIGIDIGYSDEPST